MHWIFTIEMKKKDEKIFVTKPRKLSFSWFLSFQTHIQVSQEKKINKFFSRTDFSMLFCIVRFLHLTFPLVSQLSVGFQKCIFKNSFLVRFQWLEIKNALFQRIFSLCKKIFFFSFRAKIKCKEINEKMRKNDMEKTGPSKNFDEEILGMK